MIRVADNLTITNKTIETALTEMNPDPIQQMVATCEKAGAQAIDINTGPLGRNPDDKMTFIVNIVEETTDLPILIDTANPSAMKAGLSACTKKAIINGFSLEPKKLESILPLAKEFDTDIIGYLLYPNSHVPSDANERLSIAVDIYSKLIEMGIEPERLIIDPVIVPLSWDNGKFQAREVLATVRSLPEVLGFNVRTIAGISNLTTGKGYRKEKAMFEMAYLAMLAEAGLDMALLNIFHTEAVNIAQASNMLLDDKVFSWQYNDTL